MHRRCIITQCHFCQYGWWPVSFLSVWMVASVVSVSRDDGTVPFLSVWMVASVVSVSMDGGQCRFCQYGWWHSTVTVSRQGGFLDCVHSTTNCSLYAIASSYHDRLFASCSTLFYASSITCTNDAPHVSSRYRFMPSSMM